MTQYPYGQLPNAYLNVKEAANEPGRGITAWIQGDPYLVIEKDGLALKLEGENGKSLDITTGVLTRYEPSTHQSRLVAASRLEGSPFAKGEKVGLFTTGDLIYFEKEWQVRVEDTEVALPLERLVERYDSVRWDKNADLLPGMDHRCPECGSRDILPMDSSNILGDTMMCNDCGYQGAEADFENEAPDYDQDPRVDQGFYENWTGKVADFEDEHVAPQLNEGGGNTFDYQLPPNSIHLRTHSAMKDAGLRAQVHFPPGIETVFGPVPEVLDVPTNDQASAMSVMMIDNPEQHTVQVTTPDDPEQVRQVFDQLGGRVAKVAEVGGQENEPTVDTKEALTCPNCGSHTLRAYSPEGNAATIVCLTCGNEFKRDVHINPEAAVKEAVAPIDPSLHAQILGLTQQIEAAHQQGNTQLAQQLNMQLQQLLDNPNVPLTNAPLASVDKKDSKVSNDNLADSAGDFFLESLVFEADTLYDGGDDPYGAQSVDLNQFQADEPTDERNLDYAHCPNCDGPGVLLGQLGKRIHYRCRNCGLDFSHSLDELDTTEPSASIPEADYTGQQMPLASLEEAEQVNKNTLKAFKDSSGNPLEAGKFYLLHHPSYKVPDVVKILNLEDNRIEAAIASDEHGSFPIHITHDDSYSLDPYEEQKKSASGWSVESRTNFTAQEQKELIEENMEGKARNFDKLKLEGTHYQIKEEASDPYFLLGW